MPDQPTEEQKRLMRLRDKQVSARDPHIKTRKFNQYAAERERKRDKRFSWSEAWNVIPRVWKGGAFGLILGLLLLGFVIKAWVSPLALPIMLLVTLVFVIVGVIIGNALDLRDEIKKQIK